MSQEQAKQYLMQGIQLAKAGQRDQARQYFTNAIKLDPQSETAWLWMSSVARDARERLFCLQNLLQVNPQNEQAIKGIRALGLDPAQVLRQAQPASTPPPGQAPSSVPAASASAGAIPVLAQDKLAGVMTAVDNYIHSYTPLPTLDEVIEWNLKRGGRYGEGAARRRQAIRYGLVAGAIGIVLLIIVGAVIAFLNAGGGELIAFNPTPTRTHTPTNTPTSTPGVTNTPSPEPAQTQIPFTPPANIAQGSIYGNPPTAIYPPVPVGLGQGFALAVNQYSIGDYEAAFEVFRDERERANEGATGCIPDTYYYEIVALAEQGGRRNLADARALYEDALARDGSQCENSAMLWTAACVVDYLTFLDTNDPALKTRADGWCDAALGEEANLKPPMPVAFTTRARLYALDSNFAAARATIGTGLEQRPNDLNILLVAARIELQSGDLAAALNYISQALYIEPLSETALRLRVTAFLEIAAQTSDPDRRTQLYGTAVLWAQEYLLYYPGKPEGYLLLAQARLGENNVNLAIDALTRVIEAKTTLPEAEQSVIQQAYRLRAQLYSNLARYQEALDDTQAMLQTSPDDLTLLEQQAQLAFHLGRYSLAKESLDTVLAANSQAVASGAEGVVPRFDLELLRLRLTTELCEFNDELQCEYQAALGILTDNFINGLDATQQLTARAYRAKALYHTTINNTDLSNNQRTLNLEQALTDIETVLATDETPLNLYYRGLIWEGLGNTPEAILAYRWVVYWSQFYEYPFTEDVEARLETLTAAS